MIHGLLSTWLTVLRLSGFTCSMPIITFFALVDIGSHSGDGNWSQHSNVWLNLLATCIILLWCYIYLRPQQRAIIGCCWPIIRLRRPGYLWYNDLTWNDMYGKQQNSVSSHQLRWLGSLLVMALDLQLDGCRFNSQPPHCRATTLGKLFTPTCLCSCSGLVVHAWLRCEGTRFRISLWAVVFIISATVIHSLGHGLHTLTAVPRSTQPSTLCGMVKQELSSCWDGRLISHKSGGSGAHFHGG